MEQVQERKMRPAPRGRMRMRFLRLHGAPAVSGLGSRAVSFRCSECDVLLFERVDEQNVRGLMVRCPQCGVISVA